jgi:hypothetical protein
MSQQALQLIFLLIKESLTLHMLNSMNKPVPSKKEVMIEFMHKVPEKPAQDFFTSVKLELRELNKEFDDLDS